MSPEFFSDEKVNALSYPAQRLWIALWCFADDEGRGRYYPKEIDGFAFPVQKVNVSGLLDEITGQGLIVPYEVEGQHYYFIPTWDHWQKPRCPTASKCPTPYTNSGIERMPTLAYDESQPRHIEDANSGIDRMPDSPVGDRSKEIGVRNEEVGVLLSLPHLAKPFLLKKSKVDEWEAAYPNLGVRSEIEKAIQWCLDNQASGQGKKKDLIRFLGGWLARTEERRLAKAQVASPYPSSPAVAPWQSTGPASGPLEDQLLDDQAQEVESEW